MRAVGFSQVKLSCKALSGNRFNCIVCRVLLEHLWWFCESLRLQLEVNDTVRQTVQTSDKCCGVNFPREGGGGGRTIRLNKQFAPFIMA